MPIHDWTHVDAGLFHDFHQRWTVALHDALNLGGLPPDYFALLEQSIPGPILDVLFSRMTAGEAEIYASKANRIIIRHQDDDVIAIIEIVSPGHKTSRILLPVFIEKMVHLLHQRIHLLVIDLFPPGLYDPQGIHKAIWDKVEGDSFELPTDRQLTLAAYVAGSPLSAYIEPVAVGDVLPDMPLFLKPEIYVPVPLEATYQKTWKGFPAVLKKLLE